MSDDLKNVLIIRRLSYKIIWVILWFLVLSYLKLSKGISSKRANEDYVLYDSKIINIIK